MAGFDYARMASTAERLMENFRQGLVTVQRVEALQEKPDDWPIWEPWTPETTVRQYRLDATVNTVSYKLVDGEKIRMTDQMVTCSDKMTLYSIDGALVSASQAVEEEFDVDLLNTLVIDGVSHTVLELFPKPGAGTKITRKFIVRAGSLVAPAETPDPEPVEGVSLDFSTEDNSMYIGQVI